MLDESKIAELKTKHGDRLALVSTPIGDMVFKAPTREAYDRWADATGSGKPRSASARELAQHCLVYPDFPAFTAILDALPGILTAEVVDACTIHSGLVDKYEVKKL